MFIRTWLHGFNFAGTAYTHADTPPVGPVGSIVGGVAGGVVGGLLFVTVIGTLIIAVLVAVFVHKRKTVPGMYLYVAYVKITDAVSLGLTYTSSVYTFHCRYRCIHIQSACSKVIITCWW